MLNVIAGGVGRLSWNSPAYNSGTNDVELDLNSTGVDAPWLQWDWDDADADGDPLTGLDNPTARATFGIYSGHESIIYLRETTWR